jgi:RNAse (barnase) inhibitor barstar
MTSRKTERRTLMTGETDHHSRLDRQLLQNGPITLYFKRHVLDEATEWFCQQNYEGVTFDCREWKSPEGFFTNVSQRLDFPEYFGRNLDAFNDCLSEIALPQKRGTVLVFLYFDTFTARHRQFAWAVLDIIATNAYRFLLDAYQLIALVQSDDPKLSFQPIGAHPVLWNPREWLNKNRGL